jgi:hypothetical protein
MAHPIYPRINYLQLIAAVFLFLSAGYIGYLFWFEDKA